MVWLSSLLILCEVPVGYRLLQESLAPSYGGETGTLGRDHKLPTESHLPTFESVNNSNGAATPTLASSAFLEAPSSGLGHKASKPTLF